MTTAMVLAGLVGAQGVAHAAPPGTAVAPLYKDLNNLSPTTVTIVMPPFPARTKSMKLQRGSGPMTWTTIASGLARNSSFGDSGLTKATTYTYRAVAVNNDGETPGASVSVTLPSGNPTAPIAPSYYNILPTSITIKAPGLPPDATSMEIQRGSGPFNWTTLASVGAGGTFTDSGRTANTAYSYRVMTVNAHGSTGGPSVSVTTRNGLPTAPSRPTFSDIGITSLKIKTPAMPPDATSLKVVRGGGPFGTTVASGLGAGATVTDTGLSANTSYTYTIVATNTYGDTTGGSASVTSRIAGPTAPNRPTFYNIGYTGLTIKVPGLPSDANSLTVTRGSGGPPGMPGGVTVASGLGGGATCTDSGLAAGTSYTYTVTAVGPNGNTIGGSASVTTKGASPTPPNLPTFSNITMTSVKIKAPGLPPDATSMSIQRGGGGPPGGGGGTTIASGLSSGGTFTDTGLTPGTSYSYTVTAVGTYGTRAGGGASVTTLTPNPTAPGAPSFYNIGMTSVTVKMPGMPSDATSLTLKRGSGPPGIGGTTIATGLSGGSTFNDTGLTAATSYSYTVVAVSATGSTTGGGASVTTKTPNPTSAIAPTFYNIQKRTLTIKMPGLPPDATSFTLKRGSGPPGIGGTTIATGLAGGATFDDSGLTPGTNYTYSVTVVSATGSTLGGSGSVTTRTPNPTAPNAPYVKITGTTSVSIQVTDKPSDAVSLSVQRGSGPPGIGGTTIATGLSSGDTVTDSGLTAGQSYTYTVTSVGADGNTVGGAAWVTLPPSSGTNLLVSDVRPTSIQITLPNILWNNASSLVLQRCPNQYFSPPELVETVGGGGTNANCTVGGLSPNEGWYYRAVANNSPGAVSLFASSSGRPGAAIRPLIGKIAPTSLTVELPALAADATSFSIERSTTEYFSPANTVTTIATGKGDNGTFDDTGLSPGTTYYYRAVGVNGFGSASGASIAVVTSNGLAAAPNPVLLAKVGPTTLTVELPALPAEATGLSIQRSTTQYFSPANTVTTIATGLGGGDTFDDSGLTPSTTYYYRAVAVNTYGSAPGATSTVVTTSGLSSAPNIPAIANIGPSTLTVELPPAIPAEATSLSIQRSTTQYFSPANTVTTIATGLGGGATFDDSGLTPSTTYYYRAVAVNSFGGTVGASITVTTATGLATAPNIPLIAKIGPNTLTVEVPAKPAEASSLSIQRSTSSGFSPAGTVTTIASGIGGDTTFEDSGLTPNTTYYYRIVAVNSFGSTNGTVATVVTATGLSTAPNAPAIANILTSTLTVELAALPAEADSLSIQRSTSSGFSPANTVTTIATGLAGNDKYDDSGLTPNTTYYYRAVAVNGFGSVNGASVQTATWNGLAPAPNAPSLGKVGPNSLTVELPPLPTEADSLSLQRATNSGFSTGLTTIATGLGGSGTFDDSGLTPNTLYYYRAVAVNSFGSTNGSAASTTTTSGLSAPPNVPLFGLVRSTTLTVTPPALPAEAVSLTLQRSTASNFASPTNLITGLTTGANYDDSGLTANTLYYYRALAVNSFGNVVGTSATVTTLPAPPTPKVTSLLEVRKVTAVAVGDTAEQSMVVTTTGGTAYAVLQLNIGQNTVITSATGTIRISEKPDTANEVTHPFEQNHVDVPIAFNSATGWEKYYDPDGAGAKVEDWWPSPEAPTAAATSAGAVNYRYRYSWNTTTAISGTSPNPAGDTPPTVSTTLLGHNGEHTVSLVAVDGFEGDGIDYGASVMSSPSDADVTNSNLVITSATSNGNPDYFRFDPDSDDNALLHPQVEFTIVDNGDPHRYRWWVWVKPTRGETNSVELSGIMNGPGTKLVSINSPAGTDTQDHDLTEWGTYTFELRVQEIKTDSDIGIGEPWEDLRSEKLYIPATYESGGVAVKGHDVKFEVDDDTETKKAFVSYYLEDDSRPAASGLIQFLDADMKIKGQLSILTEVRTPQNDVEIYTFDGSEEVGTRTGDAAYRAIFMAEDSHAIEYRDHKNKRMIPANKAHIEKTFHIEDDAGQNLDSSGAPAHYYPQGRSMELRRAFAGAYWQVANATNSPKQVLPSSCTVIALDGHLEDSEIETYSNNHFFYKNSRNAPGATTGFKYGRYVHLMGLSARAFEPDSSGNYSTLGRTVGGNRDARWSITYNHAINQSLPGNVTQDIKNIAVHEVGHQFVTHNHGHGYTLPAGVVSTATAAEVAAYNSGNWQDLRRFRARRISGQPRESIYSYYRCVMEPIYEIMNDWNFCPYHKALVATYEWN